jgi:hypothetical protein
MGFDDPDSPPESFGEGSDVMRDTGVRYAGYGARIGFLIKKAGIVVGISPSPSSHPHPRKPSTCTF